MKFLVLGRGGKEHALAWKLAKVEAVDLVYVLPGNSGMALDDKIECLPQMDSEISEIIDFARQEKIELTIPCEPEMLKAGVVESFREKGLNILGPTSEASELEWSKIYAKKFMNKYEIPTAKSHDFDSAPEAKNFCKSKGYPSGLVVKCDSLASERGVIVCHNAEEAVSAIDAFMTQEELGRNFDKILIEERLLGPEISAFALCRNETFQFLGNVCNYKPLKDGDLGPNTEGMGGYAPADWLSDIDQAAILEIFEKTLAGMKAEKRAFTGILYLGLIVTEEGIKVLEYNVRLGDPEAQILLPSLNIDLSKALLKATQENFTQSVHHTERYDDFFSHVVLVSDGHPAPLSEMQLGGPLSIDRSFFESLEKKNNGKLFFSDVKANEQGDLVNSGGRVAGVTYRYKSKEEGLVELYQAVDKVKFSGVTFRRDIGV